MRPPKSADTCRRKGWASGTILYYTPEGGSTVHKVKITAIGDDYILIRVVGRKFQDRPGWRDESDDNPWRTRDFMLEDFNLERWSTEAPVDPDDNP